METRGWMGEQGHEGSGIATPYPRWLTVRFYLSMLGIVVIDFCFALIYEIPLSWFAGPALLLVAAMLSGSAVIFAPIRAHLADPAQHRLPARRVAYLHVLCTAFTSATLGLLSVVKFVILPRLIGFDITMLLSAEELVLLPLIHWLFYTAVVYFVMSDYEAVLRETVFERSGQLVPAGRGRLATRLFLAFALTSILPLALVVMHVYGNDLEVGREVIVQDLLAMAIGLTVSLVFVTRSLLRPLRALEQAVERVARNDIPDAVPVLSSDETGRLARGFNRMLRGLAERSLIRETFGKYVPARVASAIVRDGGRLEPRAATATILYTDIQDFTGLAESLGPSRTVEMLNAYFSAVIAPVERNGGVVNQFQGDAMLVTFNVPVDDPDHADAAMRAGLEIARLCARETFAGVSLRTRVGIATGEVIAGSVGSDRRANYTVHGDAVNLAARLEALCRPLDAELLVDGATAGRLRRDYGLHEFGKTPVRGRAGTVHLYGIHRRTGNESVLQGTGAA